MEDNQNASFDTAANQSLDAAVTLEDIKRRALEAFIPIVDQLDGAPEQTFGLLMNAVHVSHNTVILDKALAAAQHIQDAGARAEALLDVMNEANYQSDQSA